MSKLLSNLPFLLNSFTFNHLCLPIHHFTTNNVTVLSSILIFSITSSKLFSLHLACHSRPFLCLLCSFLFSSHTVIFEGFPGGLDGKVSACNAGDQGSIPGSGRSPWRRKWQSTPALLPGKSHGGRSLIGYSPWALLSR